MFNRINTRKCFFHTKPSFLLSKKKRTQWKKFRLNEPHSIKTARSTCNSSSIIAFFPSHSTRLVNIEEDDFFTSLNSEWRWKIIAQMILIRRWIKVLISHENVFPFTTSLADLERSILFIYFYDAATPPSPPSRSTKDDAEDASPLNRSSPFSGFIVQPFYDRCSFSFVCLFVYMQSEKFSLVMFVNVLVSLNIALCKYLVFSVSVRFHWKLIVRLVLFYQGLEHSQT